MGVYNPFAELPNSCVLCDSRKKCDLHREYAGRPVDRHPDCPLVEVETPHGRLIDADALENKGADVCCSEGYYGSDIWGFSYEMIDDAPTIIEAEGKDDG